MEKEEKQSWVMTHIMPPMMKFLNTKAVTAIKNGMIYPVPFIIVGSVFLILGQFPYQPIQDYLNEIKLGPLFLQINNASFGITAILAVFGIAYVWVRNEGFEAAPAGMAAIICHILLQPDTIKSVTNIADSSKVSTAWQVSGVIDRQWLSGKGIILSIIVGLLVGWIYTGLMRRKITIKMPEQVPENVAASFTALVPAGIIITLTGIVHGIFTIGFNTTLVEQVYKLIQMPLQHVVDGPAGLFVIAFLPVFIWWFGVHGSTIIGGIMGPLMFANNVDNLELYKAHHLDLAHGAHIITQPFMDQYLTVTGAGMTIGFVIFMLVRAKSAQMKTIGKLEIGPALFNINEPILFGIPVVLNPMLAIPFILQPVLSGVLTYLVILAGIIPPLNGLPIPWTTPPIISGLIVGGWKGMIWQILMLAMSVVVYWPFAVRYDKILLAQEAEVEAEIQEEKAAGK
ncbi:PTS sugar transporter subunit IIC [Lactovum odontotermitis]